MGIRAGRETIGAAEPARTIWSALNRRSCESRMDTETAVSLRCHLYQDFVGATSWAGLVECLAAKDFALIFRGNRLSLVNERTGVDLCTCRFLGFGFAELARLLGKPRVIAQTGKIVAPARRH